LINALTIDVEDYFHVSAFEKQIKPEDWKFFPLRVVDNTKKILDLLDEFQVKATFFTLGWVAERVPGLVKEIDRRGHEVACHGYGHQRVYTRTRRQFREDIRRSKSFLEDLTGVEVLGHRAPSYSISMSTLWAFDELHEAGYRYDSSIFPIRHDFYGIPHWPRFPFIAACSSAGCWEPSEYPGENRALDHPCLLELPITTLKLLGKSIPIAGGGYFRFFPYFFIRWGLKRINRVDGKPFIFYIHPWEMDPGQPRVSGASLKSRFRHYVNLGKTERCFREMVGEFPFSSIREVLKDHFSTRKDE
jgi:polysaccharide deacetylase family protein (PEP-CTERM system associated)